MSTEEKIILVEDLWDVIAASEEEIPLTSAQIEELDRRVQHYRENPESDLLRFKEIRKCFRAFAKPVI